MNYCRTLCPWILRAAIAAADLPAQITNPASNLDPQPAVTNRVLELDGASSFVELPSGAFTNLAVATIEGSVRWDSFGSSSRFFDFAVGGRTFNVQNRSQTASLWLERDLATGVDNLEVPNALATGRWVHVAAVVGPQTLKLYLDGVLLPTKPAFTTNSTAGVGQRNYLGRSNWRAVTNNSDADFLGARDRAGLGHDDVLRCFSHA